MSFLPTAEQEAMGAAVRGLLQRHLAPTELRRTIDDPTAVRPLWVHLGEAGVFALKPPDDDGLGVADATIVFEELGRALTPGPSVWTAVAARAVPGAADGSLLVGGLRRAERPVMLEHAGVLDSVLVLDDDGMWLVDPAEIESRPVARPLDPLTPVASVLSLPQGERIGDAEQARSADLDARVLTAALLVGVAATATELAVGYAKDRQQFGRSIGSFQAIKHLLASMLASTEVARAATQSAGVHLDDPELAGHAAWSATAALTVAARAATKATAGCIQVHGGIGVTWEADPHLLAKRAQVLAASHAAGADLARLALA